MLFLNCLSEEPSLDYRFWIPIVISIIAFIWGYLNSRSLEKLKAKNEKQIHVHKERFDKEFDVYKRFWVQVYELETRINSIYNQIKTVTDNQTEQEYENHSTIGHGNYFQAIQSSSSAILQAMEIEKPFYDKSVYNKLQVLKQFIENNSLTDIKKWDSKDLKTFLKEELISKTSVKKMAEDISESIRKRVTAIETV